MLDQAEALRRLVKDSTKEKITKNSKVITITSGKGGVGKSNFVVNMAITMQKLEKKVLLFDADIGMGNDDVLMGLFPKYNIMDVIKGEVSLEEAIVEGPYGIHLLPGGTGLNNIEDLKKEQRENFISTIEAIEGYDYILIDTGAGVNKSVLAFVASSDEVIFILTPEPTSLTDGYSLIKALKHFNIKTNTNIVINRVFDKDEGDKTFNKFNMATEKFLDLKVSYLGCIYEDRKLTMAVRNQTPLVMYSPNSDAVKGIQAISKKIIGEEGNKKGIGAKGLFNKLFNIFS